MAKLNTLKTIESIKGKINPYYDMRIEDILFIHDSYTSKVNAISNAFIFGYAQGVKAQKKGRAFNG